MTNKYAGLTIFGRENPTHTRSNHVIPTKVGIQGLLLLSSKNSDRFINESTLLVTLREISLGKRSVL
jgi:hypothetical protein